MKSRIIARMKHTSGGGALELESLMTEKHGKMPELAARWRPTNSPPNASKKLKG